MRESRRNRSESQTAVMAARSRVRRDNIINKRYKKTNEFCVYKYMMYTACVPNDCFNYIQKGSSGIFFFISETVYNNNNILVEFPAVAKFCV